MDQIESAEYLFSDPGTEPTPTTWLYSVMSLPVREDHDLVMEM